MGAKPGHTVSPETRAKISATLKRKGVRPPTGHLTPEVRARISDTLTGRPQSPETIAKRIRIGEDHHQWKGDVATKEAKHIWLVKHHPKTGRCEQCGQQANTHYAFNHHPEPYTRDRSDYRELCVLCHNRVDRKNR